MTRLIAVLVSMICTTALFAGGEDAFKNKCGSCHVLKVDGKKISNGAVGPDLTGISSQRKEEYLKLYITDPEEAREKYPDVYAETKKKYSMKMPKIKVSAEEAAEILKVLK